MMTNKHPIARRSRTEVGLPALTGREMRLPDVAPPVGVRWLSLAVIVLGFGVIGGLGVWASVAPIRSAVVANGVFEVAGDAQVVQHLEGGIVTGISVREGDAVSKGDLIATLDSTRGLAQLGILENQLAGALARKARLEAEYRQDNSIAWPRDLLDLVSRNPDFQEHMDAQSELFRSNRATDDGQVAIMSERIAQLNEQLRGIEDRHLVLSEQRELVRAEVADLVALLDQGLVIKSRYVARKEDEIQLTGALSEAEASRQSVLQQIAEVEQRRLQIGRERRLEIADALQQAKEQIYDIRQRISAATDVLERLSIVAPIDGRIIGLQLNTIGAVIAPGQELLRIVPNGSDFVIVARVSPADIDEVEPGLPVRVRLSALSYRKTPPVSGTVTHVSPDTFHDEALQQNYFEVFVEVSSDDLAPLVNVQSVPGMPAQVMIATGEQTIVTYLLDPVIGGFETALVEKE